MEQSPASKSHFWAALFKPHISILDISAEEGVHISLGITSVHSISSKMQEPHLVS